MSLIEQEFRCLPTGSKVRYKSEDLDLGVIKSFSYIVKYKHCAYTRICPIWYSVSFPNILHCIELHECDIEEV
jgi:hypothetical protein